MRRNRGYTGRDGRMRKNKLNGQGSRGHRGRLAKRARRHQLRVERLSELLGRDERFDPWLLRHIAIRGYYPAHPHLFTVREVAGATGATPKFIRAAARSGFIKSKHLPSPRARKMFFDTAAVRRFVNRLPEFKFGGLRSEKIALNTHFVRGDAVTMHRAMMELGLKKRGVQYYLNRGILKKIPCGHRTVLIKRGSLERLRERRLSEALRRFSTARKRLEKMSRSRLIVTPIGDRRFCGERP
jgi:hypothetical protein